jgi:serine/threonine protein kinase
MARHLVNKYDVDWNTVLGFGTYGAVYSGINSSNGNRVALKVMSKRGTDQFSFRREATALLQISDNGGHPNITCLRDVYEDDNYYYLVLDLICGGEIFDHLVNEGVFSEDNAIRLMRQAASALLFLHTIGVVHADLKPENLMLCSAMREHGTLRIIDFGSARVDDDHRYHVDGTDRASSLRSEVSTGTVAYWAPERFVKGSEVTPATDMWSIGIILYIMLTGVHPFDPEGCTCDKVVEERIKCNPKSPLHAKCTDKLSPSAMDLIEKLMEPDPSKRLDAAGMLDHSWIKGHASESVIAPTSSSSKVSTS